ncbi:ShlB/FhaC/HecB family hemolysin secretion/activation protein [Methylotenera sp.]|uniref:ShlB/FhaC/HecB family hemolysin secretion/activation protein n=1 Tax=Methylotenera sp. TaxID=2051956 RepID=UPI002720240E|nr:ShlB/FhaC/HecB family hemolysin secretion/activation protein [Methylotenera sp.]MDO9205800.1 ShlB/FhaC/HecB family hemolysin secretion/activation protein [Methylotenera sp.]MDO9205891.1 ShlB/FhaC/HecB family hemolysin secretion/activation protein [Methylotenera sp.]MDP3818023.1 ShlB/FhaC/HecB family hemolysin secretion/activation protein [Methylotenera sp.]MDZ4212606.1 ShlB/FhaC/HecB family hemolysin secretion/activation protein [Methylotenera sp.]
MIIPLKKPDLLRITVSIIAAICASFFIVTLATAAPALPDSANIPRIETQPKLPVITSPAIEKKEDLKYPAALPETSGIKVNINSIKFSGNKNVSDDQLLLLLKAYLGQSLGIKELNQMTALVTNYYRRQGFILAQAYLPEQDINQNALEIAVVEGYLGELRIKGIESLDEVFLKKIASHDLASNDAVKESNLVRNIMLINSLPGLNATSQLNPGQEVGYSDVDIEVQTLPRMTGFISANTYGNRFTGREVVNAGLFLNNLAGRGDRLNLNLKTSNGGGQRGVQIGYVLPVHQTGTILNLSTGYLDYHLGGQFSSLGAKGESYYVSALLDQPLLRSRQGNITSRLGTSYKDITDDVSAFSLKDHRGISAVELGLFGDWRDISLNGFNQLGLNIKLADVNFKNNLAESLDSTGAKTAGGFIKYNLLASRLQPLSEEYTLRLSSDFQGANKNLDSSEKLAIGGINRWREFGEYPISSDRGLIVGAELRRMMLPISGLARFLPVLQRVEVSPYGFYDYGKGVINHNALSSDNHVKSSHYGVGIDALLTKKWMLNFAVSHQKSQVDGVASENETRAWGQIQAEF